MTGRPNKKWMETMIQKHGSREAVTRAMKELGSRGGAKSRGGGFSANRELASTAGRKGGLKSRRGKAKLKDEDVTYDDWNEEWTT